MSPICFSVFFFILGKKEGTERGTTCEEGVFDISLNFLANPKSHSCQETNYFSTSFSWSKALIKMWKSHNIKISTPSWFHFHPIECLMVLSHSKLFPLNVSIWYIRQNIKKVIHAQNSKRDKRKNEGKKITYRRALTRPQARSCSESSGSLPSCNSEIIWC